MSDMSLGTSSAKRATWRTTDCRPVVERIIKENPGVGREEWFRLFYSEVRDDDDQVRSIIQYYFDLVLMALNRPARASSTATRAEVRERTKALKTQIKARVEQEAKIVLMQMLMPNNKILGDCTGAECRRFGGWLTELSRRVPAKSTVAETLSEAQLYKLWQQTRK